MDQTTGKRIAPQHSRSTRNKTSIHRPYSLEPSSVDSIMMYATLARTCRGMTIMKIFLSLSERICLTKAQPVPINAIVMNNSAPFSK